MQRELLQKAGCDIAGIAACRKQQAPAEFFRYRLLLSQRSKAYDKIAARVAVGHGKDIDPVQKLRPDRYRFSARGKGFVKKRPRHSIPSAERIAAGISNCISPSGICTATCSVRPLTQTLPSALSRIFKVHNELFLAFGNGGPADEFIAVAQGIDMLGGGFDDGKNAIAFYIKFVQVYAAWRSRAERASSKYLK